MIDPHSSSSLSGARECDFSLLCRAVSFHNICKDWIDLRSLPLKLVEASQRVLNLQMD